MNSRRMIPTVLLLLALPIQYLVQSCGTARRYVPVGQVTYDQLAPVAVQGEEAFMRFCHKCHPGGETGLGPALNNKNLSRYVISFQVRNGLGAMPSFSDETIPDSTLSAIIEYMRTVRKTDPGVVTDN